MVTSAGNFLAVVVRRGGTRTVMLYRLDLKSNTQTDSLVAWKATQPNKAYGKVRDTYN